jgi:uncharacterized protein
MAQPLRIGLLLPVLMLALATAAIVHAQPQFPPLTGRVVDRADMLEPSVEAQLSRMLAAHEQATTEQVVVVTLQDLQGYGIEEYGYQLGRHWGIGQRGEDNGALLIIAEDERSIRIEVGYGLEGRLTDAQSSLIINRIIEPAFRQGDFTGGIVAGTEAMIQVLGGNPLARPADDGRTERRSQGPLPILILALIMLVMMFGRGRRGLGRGALGGFLLGSALGGGRHHGGFGGGGFGGGGFSGGGGGFGGGGASGGW